MVLGNWQRCVFIVAVWGAAVALASGCQSAPEFEESQVLHSYDEDEASPDDYEGSEDWLPIVDEEPPAAGDIRTLQNCAEYPFDPAVRGPWDSLQSKEMAQDASPMHRSTDQVVAVGQRVNMAATMEYDQGPLSREWVRLFVGTCDGWTQRGVRRTDDSGAVVFPVEERMPAGIYGVVFQAVGDGTATRSQFWVISPETEVVAIDISGAAFEEGAEAKSSEPEPVSGAAELSRWHASKGRLVVYINRGDGGDGEVNPRARELWRKHLRKHRFAVGPVVDAELAENLGPEDGEANSGAENNGWGEATSKSRSGPGITTAVAALYVQDAKAAQFLRDSGLRAKREVHRDDYCRETDDGQRRTGWERLVTEISGGDSQDTGDGLDEGDPG